MIICSKSASATISESRMQLNLVLKLVSTSTSMTTVSNDFSTFDLRLNFATLVFWFGDLNFRLYSDEHSSLTQETIREMVKREQLSELLTRDQLSIAMCEGRAFSELVERLPQFPPTFKFEHGTSEYDMKRRPAWCDRILYKAKNKILKNCSLQLEQLSYKSHPNYKLSDHKPVSSEFKIKASTMRNTIFMSQSNTQKLHTIKSKLIHQRNR